MISLGIITVASVAIVFVVSLRTANEIHARMLKDDDRPTRASIAEKRRILERDRKEWLSCIGDPTTKGATKAMEQIDKKLLALADEEIRCDDEVA